MADLCTDKQGVLWLATDGGLSQLKDGRVTNYTTAQGLATNTLRALHCDADGSVWIGTVSGGLQRLSDGRVQSQTVAGLNPSAEIRSILRDSQGAL